jgi:hypothetical protein
VALVSACAVASPADEGDDMAASARCGDRDCNGAETINTCPEDCGGQTGAMCGDGVCNGTESSASCNQDCTAPICGDGNCNGGETSTTCAGDCGGGGGGTCAHDVCTSGAALASSCSTCAAAVCAADPYCCSNQWDSSCVEEVADYCPTESCGGGGGGGGTCDHDECTTGAALSTSCSACTAAVCAVDSYCCNFSWDSTCVEEVDTECGGTPSCGGGGGGGTCSHSECTSGTALPSSCSACTAAVCAEDPFCCTTSWDSICVGEVADYCAPATCP